MVIVYTVLSVAFLTPCSFLWSLHNPTTTVALLTPLDSHCSKIPTFTQLNNVTAHWRNNTICVNGIQIILSVKRTQTTEKCQNQRDSDTHSRFLPLALHQSFSSYFPWRPLCVSTNLRLTSTYTKILFHVENIFYLLLNWNETSGPYLLAPTCGVVSRSTAVHNTITWRTKCVINYAPLKWSAGWGQIFIQQGNVACSTFFKPSAPGIKLRAIPVVSH